MHVHLRAYKKSTWHSKRLGWSQLASKANDLFILINENLHTFNTPIKRLFSTSLAQFAIRQVTFDPLEFNTSPMNSHITEVFRGKDMRAYTMDATRRVC
jgi:hypothetical protein